MSTQSPSVPRPQKVSRPEKCPNNIRKAIQQSPWKFYQVAEKTKIPRDTLSDYCAGKYPVPNDRRDALAELLQCLPEYLVPPLPNIREAYWSQSQYEETKDLEALLLLRSHCHLHPTDENALQQLMELLGKVGRYPEMEKWYERFLQEVKKEDIWRKPDASTTELLAQLRTERPLTSSEHFSKKAGQGAHTSEEGAYERATHAIDSSAPSGSGEPPGPSPVTQTERIGETVFLTIAIPSSEIQALAQASQSEQEAPLVTSIPQPPPSTSLQPLALPPSKFVSPQGILLRGAGANTQELDTRNLRDYYLASSTEIVGSLKTYSTHGQGELTTGRQQIDIYETIEQRRIMNDEHIIDPSKITRRDLYLLATVSTSLLTSMRRGWPAAGGIEEFLSEVTASVTTCWYSFRSDGLTIVEYAVPQYLPELEELVKYSSLYRKRAAYLTAQGFLLLSFVAYNRLRFADEIAHCQKAVTYAYESGDRILLVESQRMLGSAFLDAGQLDKMLNAYLQAECYSQGIDLPGFVRSKVQAKLSQGYAKHGKSQEVLRYRGEAERIFTEADDEIPVFLRTTHGRFQIILEEGRSTLDLGDHAQGLGNTSDALKYWMDAAERFGKMEQLPSDIIVPLGTSAEIEIKRALAYAKARNMEGFLTAFEKGAKLAKELGSEKRKQEAKEALEAALEHWKDDQRITGLWGLLI